MLSTKHQPSLDRPGDLDDAGDDCVPTGIDLDPSDDALDAVGEGPASIADAFCVSTANSLRPTIEAARFSGIMASYDCRSHNRLARVIASVCVTMRPIAQAVTIRLPNAPAVTAAPLQIHKNQSLLCQTLKVIFWQLCSALVTYDYASRQAIHGSNIIASNVFSAL